MNTWKIRSKVFLIDRPLVAGILNLTPDSFYDGGQFSSGHQAVEHALRLVRDGADILDVGAESTRPGAPCVSESEELDRLMPVVTELVKSTQTPVSVDTTKSAVAEEALRAGAAIVNDVSAFQDDPRMAEVARRFEAGVILMHRRGNPRTMQNLTEYTDVVADVKKELGDRFREAVKAGISEEQIVLDPGIGLPKTADQNFEILKHISDFLTFRRPILVGPSRKSFIGAVSGAPAEKRLAGTVAACVTAVLNGARIVRVHDVAEVKQALAVAERMLD